MGKAVPKNLKSRAAVLMKEYPDKFTIDFEQNKQFLDSLELPFSNQVRNLISGFITRKVRQKLAA